jgi:small lipoprotein (TIGR04454 family)
MSLTASRRCTAVALAASLAAISCGHPATEAECEAIVERVARLEIEKKNPGNAQAVQDEIEATKKSVRESMLKECVGRRITQKAMECVRTAKTGKEIVEDCFD